jgi:hypothetical protein
MRKVAWRTRDCKLRGYVSARCASALCRPPAARLWLRLFFRCVAVKHFGYLRDPLCLVACALYVFNRVWWRGDFGGVFLTGYFNDLLLIPAALPLVLWLQRRLGVRAGDAPPRWREIALHLAVWSVTAEGIMPQFTARATGDWHDVVAYTAGAIVAGCWWQDSGMG